MLTPQFSRLVFAGGGNRCFWQGGFYQAMTQELELNPSQIASVSAGSAISCAIFSGTLERALDVAKEAMARNPRNRYLANLFNEKPVFPHAPMYRQMLRESMDSIALKRLQSGPRNRILIAEIPKWLGPKSATMIGIGAYQLEKKLRQPVHPVAGRSLGFRSRFVEANQCKTVDELIDVILCSSCTPPFTPQLYLQGRPILDGGLIDNVPIHGVDEDQGEGDTLVLLSRPYRKLPSIKGRLYVQPSRALPVDSWDYTNPEGVQATYDLGFSDGLKFLRRYQRSA